MTDRYPTAPASLVAFVTLSAPLIQFCCHWTLNHLRHPTEVTNPRPLQVRRACSSERRNILASKFCAMVFESRETKIGMVVLHGNVKKL